MRHEAKRQAPVEALKRAIALYQAGHLAEAERNCRIILRTKPNDFDALHLLALVQSRRGHYEQADLLISRALAVNPNSAEALYNRSIILSALERYQEALAISNKSLAIKPDYAEALNQRGALLKRLNRPEDALASFDQALSIEPDFAEALNNRGLILQELNRPADALASFDRALALRPDYAEALCNRSLALKQLQRRDEALAAVDRAVSVKPDYLTAWNIRGVVLHEVGRSEEALASFDRALAIRPDAEALTNRGIVLAALRRLPEALESFDAALRIKPDDPEAHWNRALCKLQLGDFESGWEEYEWRWQSKSFDPVRRTITADRYAQRYPSAGVWDGGFVNGTLLAWGAQGVGDQVFFAGMVEDLKLRARRLIVEAEPRLVELFRRSFTGVAIAAHSETPDAENIDSQVALVSCGRYLRRTLADFPRRDQGYLIADSARTDQLRDRITRPRCRSVGLSWHSANPVVGKDRSIPLERLCDILKMPGYNFIDLQYGSTHEERSRLEARYGIRVAHLDDIDNFQDIDGLAALISACDLVITIDNTTVHLAGALGRPTWLLLPFAADWRWLLDRDDTPWYSTVRLFRQPRRGDWDSVIARVASELERVRRPNAS